MATVELFLLPVCHCKYLDMMRYRFDEDDFCCVGKQSRAREAATVFYTVVNKKTLDCLRSGVRRVQEQSSAVANRNK